LFTSEGHEKGNLMEKSLDKETILKLFHMDSHFCKPKAGKTLARKDRKMLWLEPI